MEQRRGNCLWGWSRGEGSGCDVGAVEREVIRRVERKRRIWLGEWSRGEGSDWEVETVEREVPWRMEQRRGNWLGGWSRGEEEKIEEEKYRRGKWLGGWSRRNGSGWEVGTEEREVASRMGQKRGGDW